MDEYLFNLPYGTKIEVFKMYHLQQSKFQFPALMHALD